MNAPSLAEWPSSPAGSEGKKPKPRFLMAVGALAEAAEAKALSPELLVSGRR